MTVIANTFTRLVVASDRRDPRVSWQRHIDQGSLGGVDLAYPKGTPVAAPAAGVFRYLKGNGGGGNIGRITLPDASRIEFLHLEAPLVKSGSVVKLGTLVVLSGDSGTPPDGGHYAAHLHVHYILPNGSRVNLWDYFTQLTEKSKSMDYGVIKGDQKDTCYAYRLANGSLRPLLRAELGGFLSTGVTVQTVPQAAVEELLAASPPWFPGGGFSVADSQGIPRGGALGELSFTGTAIPSK
jgi:murein DD-endopeptidase MepM/ murein hydrolase activator NlpD